MNKKIWIGASVLMTASGIAIIGSIAGGVDLANKRRNNLAELREKQNLEEHNSSVEDLKNQVWLNNDYSIIATTSAKLVFELPTSLRNHTVTLKYTKEPKEDDKKANIQFASETASQFVAQNGRAIFLLNNLTSNYVYQYEILINETTINKGTFLTKFTPSATAQAGYKSAELTISGLGSFSGRTLMIKAVPNSSFAANNAEDQFRNTVFSQLFDVPLTNSPTGTLSTKVVFRPVGLENSGEYRYVVFDQQGLVPLMDIKTPPIFKTLEGALEVSEIYGYHKSGSVKLSKLSDYAGTTLQFAYHKVTSDSSLFLTRSASFIAVPVGQNVDELVLNIPNLEANSIYKFNIFPAHDTAHNDPFFKGDRGTPASDKTLKTNGQPFISSTLQDKANPMLEARAVKLQIEGLAGYTDSSLLVRVVQKPTTGTNPDWTGAILGSTLIKKTIPAVVADTSNNIAASPAKDYWESNILGLVPNTEYIYQIFGGDGVTPLLATPSEFKTMVGFSTTGVTVNVPPTVAGQTKATFTFSATELMQFYGGVSDVVPAPTNQLEIRYKEVENADVEVTANFWDDTATSVGASATITKQNVTISYTNGVYVISPQELTLSTGKVYKAAIFFAPNKLAPVSEVLNFEMNTIITGSTVNLENKVLISLESLKTYKGKELEVSVMKKSSTVALSTQKFTVGEALVQSLEFKDLEAATEYTYIVALPKPAEVVPPADNSATTPSMPAASTNENQLMSSDFTTVSSKVDARIPAESINPTSVIVKLLNLEALKNHQASIVYRKKAAEGATSTAWESLDLGEITGENLEKTILETQPGLVPNTEYEFNVVWNKAREFPILETHATTKTKTFVTITETEITQTSGKLTYGAYNTYPNQTFTLKYWSTTETEINDETKQYISSQQSTGTSVVSVPATITDQTDIFSSLTNLQPNSRYAYQLFNGNVPVSDMKLFATQKQVLVAATESFASGFLVTLNNLNTITGEGANDLVMSIIEYNSDSINARYEFNFTRTSDTQDVLAYNLPSATNKNYEIQIYKRSDTTFKNPLITTNRNSDRRSVKTLESNDIPQLKPVIQRAANSALFEFNQLQKFIGKTLVIKYKHSYWDPTLSKNVEVEKTIKTVVEKNELNFALTGLAENQLHFYEVFVEVNGTNDKISLLTYKMANEERSKFITASSKVIANKPGLNFILPKEAKLSFVNTYTYVGAKLVLKAVEKSANPDWTAATVVSSEAVRPGFKDKDATSSETGFSNDDEVVFSLNKLKPETEYLYQLFVDGLAEPLLLNNGTLKTKGEIKLQATEVYATKMRLLLSNLDGYVGQTLKVKYREKKTLTASTNTWKEIQTTVNNIAGGTNFTSETVVPIPLASLEAGKEYEFEIVAIESVRTKTTSGSITTTIVDSKVNLLAVPGFTQSTLTTNVGAVYLPGQEATQATVTLYTLGNLKDVPLKLYWKTSDASSWSDTNLLTFTIPSDHAGTSFTLPNPLTGIDLNKEYNLLLVPNYVNPSEPHVDGDNLLSSNYGQSLKGSEIKIVATAKSTFSEETKKATKASDLATKVKFEEKYDSPTATAFTVIVSENTATKNYFNANDADGKLFVVVVVKNKDTVTDSPSLEYTLVIDGFKQETTAAPANPPVATVRN